MIADNTGIGSPPLSVFPAEVVNYTRFKFLLQVNLMVGNLQNTADVFCPMRLMLKVCCVPEAQVYAYYFTGAFFEQQGSDGRIHASAQCHGDFSFQHKPWESSNTDYFTPSPWSSPVEEEENCVFLPSLVGGSLEGGEKPPRTFLPIQDMGRSE